MGVHLSNVRVPSLPRGRWIASMSLTPRRRRKGLRRICGGRRSARGRVRPKWLGWLGRSKVVTTGIERRDGGAATRQAAGPGRLIAVREYYAQDPAITQCPHKRHRLFERNARRQRSARPDGLGRRHRTTVELDSESHVCVVRDDPTILAELQIQCRFPGKLCDGDPPPFSARRGDTAERAIVVIGAAVGGP
jgi:hypothetical protein